MFDFVLPFSGSFTKKEVLDSVFFGIDFRVVMWYDVRMVSVLMIRLGDVRGGVIRREKRNLNYLFVVLLLASLCKKHKT